MRKLFIILAIIFCVNISQVYAADTALDDMTADASPTDDDLIYSLNDPAGTPADRKVTWANAWAYMYAKITATIGSSYDTSAELDALFAAKQDSLTFGIADTNALQVDATAGAPNDNEIARFTATGIEGLTYAELATVTQSANEGVLTLSNLQGAVTDAQVPDTITIDQATLATTVTVSDDESTDDNQEIVFTTDNTNLESDGDLTYNPLTGTLSATHFSGELEGSDLDIANATIEATIAANDLILIYDTSAGANRAMTRGNFVTGIGAGQAIILDIEDDGGNDSTDLGEIATKNDTNNIFTMPSADKLYIDLAQNWPQADTAVAASTQVITDNAITTVDDADAADNDFAKFTANGLEGRSYTEVLADLGIDSAANLESTLSMGAYFSDIAAATSEANFKSIVNLEIGTDVLAQQTIGIADNNLLEVDGSPNSGEIAIFTASGLNGNNEAEFKAAFNLEAGTDYEAVDADILRADTADDISVDMEWQDSYGTVYGTDGNWKISYDEITSDSLKFATAATAAASTSDPMFLILADSGNAQMTADQVIFGIYKYTTSLFTVDEDGDVTFAGSIQSTASGQDSFLQLNNNSGGLAASGYRVYFETDGSDVISYCLNGSEKRFANLEDVQTFSGAKTFSYDIIMSEVADHQSTPGAGYGYLWVKSDTPSSLIFTDDAGTDYDLSAASSGDVESVGDCISGACLDGTSDGGTYIRLYNSTYYAQFSPPTLSANVTYTFPSATSTIATLQGSDTQVIFNSGGTAYAGDAGFVFNSTTDALTLGENGQDGTLILYNESGGTDYNLTLQPGTQSAAATITFPGSTSTLATLGLAETFSALKTFSAGIDIDEDVDIDFDANDEEMNIASSATDYAADSAMVTIINSGAGQTNAHYLLRLRHTADGDAQDHFLVAEDNNGDDMFKVDSGGVVTAVGAITSGGTITSSGLFDVTGATGLDLGSADVTDITLLGQSEDLALTPSADTWTVSSSTGVTDISFSAINISTTGVIKGRASYGADITGAIGHNTTATHGVFYHFTAAATVTLDAAADAGYGAQVCYRVRDAAEAAVIDVDASEKINLAGTALAVGTAITATGAGESVCMVATTDTDGSGTDGWETWGATSGWASE